MIYNKGTPNFQPALRNSPEWLANASRLDFSRVAFPVGASDEAITLTLPSPIEGEGCPLARWRERVRERGDKSRLEM
ncbi:MAG: hypothetical protein WC749_06680 [Dehalococcoidia bacterium]